MDPSLEASPVRRLMLNRVGGAGRLLAVVVAVGLWGAAGMAVGADVDVNAVYGRHCVSCHGKDGKAQTPVGRKLGVKDLTQSRVSDADIEKQLLEGTKDARGQQRMPAFKDKLSPAEVKALVAWVKTLRP
jgi:mono/diheme cytochrome c family protein